MPVCMWCYKILQSSQCRYDVGSVVQGRADAPAKTDEWVTSYSMNEDGWVTSFQDTKNNEYQLAHPAEVSYGGWDPPRVCLRRGPRALVPLPVRGRARVRAFRARG